MKEEIFKTETGENLVCSLWADVEKPVGIVQIIHGMNEHMQFYEQFARFLNSNGYIVFGDDHRAHGRTAINTKNIGKTGGIPDLFDTIVHDELEIFLMLKKRFNIPVFIFAHSYGSFIAQKILEIPGVCPKAVCLSGTALYSKTLLLVAKIAAWFGQLIWGPDANARAIEALSPIGRARRNKKHLTRDETQIARIKNNPMTAKYFSYGFYFSLFKNLLKLNQNICNKSSVLIISGACDIFNKNAQLARKLYHAYQIHEIPNLTLEIYPNAKHNLVVDSDYMDVQKDIIKFLNDARINPLPLIQD